MNLSRRLFAWVCLFCGAGVAFGQSPTPVVINPTDTQTIVQPSGTVLNVVGPLQAGEGTNGTAVLDAYSGSVFLGNNGNAAANGISINSWSNVGIGTPWANGELSIVVDNPTAETGAHIVNTAPDGYSVMRLGVDGAYANGSAWHQFNAGYGGIDPASAYTPLGTNITAYEAGGLSFVTFAPAAMRFFTSGYAAANERMRIDPAGNVGIGTTTPGSPLEIHGNVTISGTGAGIYFPGNTTPQTVPWTGSLYGQDYADSVDVSGERKGYEPGDVLVIDPASPRHFLKSSEPYSTLAAGVYSTKPGVVGRRNADKSRETAEVPLAMVGIVPTKVSAENGPVKAGDLLVTSSTPGYAMRGTDRNRLTGAVLGKALGNLHTGTGVIDVLISLQ